MGRVMNVNGSSAEDFGKALEKLNVKIGQAREGNKAALESFAGLGLKMSDLAGLSTDAIFYRVADALAATGDKARISAGLTDLMGKSAVSMTAAVSKGSDELRKLVSEAKKLNAEDVAALAQVKDDIKNGWETALGWGGKFLALLGNIAASAGEISALASGGATFDGMIAGKVAVANKAREAQLIAEANAQWDAKMAEEAAAEADKLKAAEKAIDAELDYLEVRGKIKAINGDETAMLEVLKQRHDLASERHGADSLEAEKAKLAVLEEEAKLKEKSAKFEAEQAKLGREYVQRQREAAALMQRNLGSLRSATAGRYGHARGSPVSTP
ncbi:MAG: hypothetical protein ACK45B_05205 [Limisphaerales bacterium]